MTQIMLTLTLLLIVVPNLYAQEFTLSGIHKEYYPNGAVKTKAQYKNGKPHGYVQEYFENGQLAFVQYVRNGKINGPVKAYYDNGQIKGETTYVDNLEHGVLREYYPSGVIKEEAFYVRGEILKLKSFDEKGNLLKTQEGNFPPSCFVKS